MNSAPTTIAIYIDPVARVAKRIAIDGDPSDYVAKLAGFDVEPFYETGDEKIVYATDIGGGLCYLAEGGEHCEEDIAIVPTWLHVASGKRFFDPGVIICDDELTDDVIAAITSGIRFLDADPSRAH